MRVVLHLGYPRTGSTFLQTNVFPKHKEINFLGPKKGNCCVSGFMIKFKKTKDLLKRFLIPYKGT